MREPWDIGPWDTWSERTAAEKWDGICEFYYTGDEQTLVHEIIGAAQASSEAVKIHAMELLHSWLDEKARNLEVPEKLWEQHGRPERS